MDNAAEFKSEALRRGCEQHGIRLRYRPPGQPHFGGIVERIIGTMMQMVHECRARRSPTPPSAAAYDSDRKAALTLRRAAALAGPGGGLLSRSVHETLGSTPAARLGREGRRGRAAGDGDQRDGVPGRLPAGDPPDA